MAGAKNRLIWGWGWDVCCMRSTETLECILAGETRQVLSLQSILNGVRFCRVNRTHGPVNLSCHCKRHGSRKREEDDQGGR